MLINELITFATALLVPLAATLEVVGKSTIRYPMDLGDSVNSTETLECRCFPGDPCWPTTADWAALNATVGGRLIATIPIASMCHYDNFPGYDSNTCAALQAVWGYPETHYTTSSSPMAAWFANDSCNPFTPPSSKCRIGAYVQYAVNATSKEDFQATLAFATNNNIRLVIRNTGHDYFGKSTGAGALALWTHYLKDIQVISNYSSSAYQGAALKLDAGVQAFEAYAAADAVGLAVVGGNCESVGISGGYSQGGGLGPLSSTFGLGADQVLEWEVITASGDHIVATPNQYEDLYWALSGGGGGTFAAVLSATVRAHPTMKVASANLTFSGADVSVEVFRGVIKTFLKSLPRLADAGTWSSFYIVDNIFQLVPVFGPNLVASELQALLNPTLAALNDSGIPYGEIFLFGLSFGDNGHRGRLTQEYHRILHWRFRDIQECLRYYGTHHQRYRSQHWRPPHSSLTSGDQRHYNVSHERL